MDIVTVTAQGEPLPPPAITPSSSALHGAAPVAAGVSHTNGADARPGNGTQRTAPLVQAVVNLLAGHELPLSLPHLMDQLELHLIDRALMQTRGNKKAAADMLGLQRTTLVEKLRRRGLLLKPLGAAALNSAGAAAAG